jgi:tetratricopeptide (TPR) repeat protein
MLRTQKDVAEISHPQQESLTSTEQVQMRYYDAQDWFSRNKNTAYIALGVLVAAIAGLYFYNQNKEEQNERASALLSRIVPMYLQGDYRKAVDGDPSQKVGNESTLGLRQIVSEYGSTDAGNQAALFLANSYYYLGQPDSALAMFDKVDIDAPVVQASVEAGRAAVLEDKGNKAEAAKLFESAAKRSEENPLNADYYLSAAQGYEAAGNKDEAIRLYKMLLEEYQGTQYDDAAKRALIKLGVEA